MKVVIKVSEQCIVYAKYPQISENIIAARDQMMN